MSWKNTDVLITGGLGFIGSNLAHDLVELEASVTLLDVNLNGYGANLANIKTIRDAVTIVETDVRDAEAVASHVLKNDVIFHLAAQLSRTISNSEPATDAEINCTGLLNVLSAAESATDPPRVVFTSSQAVVGHPPSLPFDETTRAAPLDVYGANKRAGELYCGLYHESHGVPTVAVRLTNVYGPRAQLSNPNYGVINNFISAALRNEALTVFKPGTMKRDFIYVQDVTRGLRRIGSERQAIGERYILGTGNAITVHSLAELTVEAAGSGSVELVPWPEDWESIRVGDLRSDPSKMYNHYGWEPETDLTKGLSDTIDYYRSRQQAYFQDRQSY